MGTSEKVWISLIRKSLEIGVERQIFAKCLRMKYQDFIEQGYRDQVGPKIIGTFMEQPKYWMKFPPLHTACVYGQLEIVKLIYHFKIECNRPLFYQPKYYVMPIFVAIWHGHTEIVKFLADTPKELQNPSIAFYIK